MRVIRSADILSVFGQYWDPRTPRCIASLQLPERCYAMDIAYPLMVVGTAELNGDRNILIVDLNKPTEVFKVCASGAQGVVLACMN